MKFLIAFLLFSKNIMSSPIEVKNKQIKLQKVFNQKKIINKKTVLTDDHSNSELNEIKRLDSDSKKAIKDYLDRSSLNLIDLSNKLDVKTGTAIKAILLNSVVSSNLDSPILIETIENLHSIPKGSKFACSGISKNKRVLALCSKLILEFDEYEVDTILLNNDGTAGLLGKAYSGREQYAAAAITGAALKGALDVSLERMNSTIGTETVRTTSNNKIKSGGIGALDEVIQMSTDEYKNQETKISIDAGKEVLVYFNKRLKI